MSIEHLTAHLTSRDFSQRLLLPGVTLEVQKFDRNAQFGYRSAEIIAAGDFRALRQLVDCVRCGVEIVDGRGMSVWSGFVWEVQLSGEGMQVGTALDGVTNRVQVEYTAVGGQPSDTVATETDWANDDDSVSEYGMIEEKVRMQQSSSAAAIDRRDLELNNRALPFGDVKVSGGGQPGAVLRCVGWYKSLAFRYWENTSGASAGLIVHDRTTNLDSTNYLLGFSRTATTLSFTAANGRLNDSANSLGLSTNNVIVISGSTSNDGIYNVIQMSTGDWVQLSPGVVNEAAGASITYTILGSKNAQSFTLDSNDPFRAEEIQIHLETHSSPSDSLNVMLYSDSAGSPGSLLATGTLAASEIADTPADWHRFVLDSAVSLAFNTTYWIVLERTGSLAFNGYLLTVDADGGYADGEIKCWDGSTWVDGGDYYGDHDLLFRVLGTTETTSIIERVASSAGARLASYGAGFQDDGVRLQYPQIDLPQQANLISWWPLEETSGTRFDSHGSNHLADNNTVTTNAAKVGANAAQFTSANSEWLSHASNASLQTGDVDFTITGWVYFDSAATMVLVEKEDAGGNEYRLAKNGAGQIEFTVWVAATPKVATTSALSLSTWYFVVAWHDATGNTVNIQIDNGTAVSTATGGSLGAATTAAVQVGRKYDSTLYYNGRIDELTFWKTVLTPGEKTSLYNSGGGLGYAAAVYAYPDMAQSFQLSAGDVVEYITLYLKKVGSPTGTLTLRIETDSGGSPSGTLVSPHATATMSESALSTGYTSETFTFAETFGIDGSTTYWLVLTTDSSASLVNAAVWGTDRSNPNYVNGTLKVKNGGTWYDSEIDACFEVFGVGAGQFITDVIIRDASGVYTSAQRDGNERALEVIRDLLEAGSSNNRQMLMEIDNQRRMILYEEPARPAAGQASYRIRAGDGGLEIVHVPSGQVVPPHECPVGVWVDVEALLDGGLGARLAITPVFVQQVGYDAQGGKLTGLVTRDRKDVFDIERDRSREYHNRNQAALVKLISDQTGG